METERGPLLITYETVDGATPASAATSFRVTLAFGTWEFEWLLRGNYALPSETCANADREAIHAPLAGETG